MLSDSMGTKMLSVGAAAGAVAARPKVLRVPLRESLKLGLCVSLAPVDSCDSVECFRCFDSFVLDPVENVWPIELTLGLVEDCDAVTANAVVV